MAKQVNPEEEAKVVGTSWNSQTGPNGYRLQFETDNKVLYDMMQSQARSCIDLANVLKQKSFMPYEFKSKLRSAIDSPYTYEEINELLEYFKNKHAYIQKENQESETPKIVYCKDCIHRDPEDRKCDSSFGGNYGIFAMADNDFCSCGVKKEEEK